jgi:hypothetical protein
LHDESQDKGALSGRLAGQESLQVELGAASEDGLDVTVGQGGDGANGFATGQEGLPLKRAADEVEEGFGQVRQVSQGTVLDLTVVAVGLAQQVTDVDASAMLTFDLGHMHGSRRLSHVAIVG